MRISKLFTAISQYFEICEKVIIMGFVSDKYFRIFLKSKIDANVSFETIIKEIAEKHHLFEIDFRRSAEFLKNKQLIEVA